MVKLKDEYLVLEQGKNAVLVDQYEERIGANVRSGGKLLLGKQRHQVFVYREFKLFPRVFEQEMPADMHMLPDVRYMFVCCLGIEYGVCDIVPRGASGMVAQTVSKRQQ